MCMNFVEKYMGFIIKQDKYGIYRIFAQNGKEIGRGFDSLCAAKKEIDSLFEIDNRSDHKVDESTDKSEGFDDISGR